MSWSDERVELLKKLWSEGQSASQIAKELGAVTRNAVIGKVHRLGLSNRNSGTGASTQTPEPESPAPEPAARDEGHDGAAASTQSASTTPASSDPEEVPHIPAHDTQADDDAAPAVAAPQGRGKTIVPANQPLPPQPSANEIDPEALARVSEIEQKARRLSLMELTERTCKWPVGDPATEDFWFCGLPVQPGKPYCEAHVGVAFQPMSSRRDRRR